MVLVKIEAVGGINNIHPTLWKYFGRIADRLERRYGLDLVINSIDGDRHMHGSFHYIGRAIDFSVLRRNGILTDAERSVAEDNIRETVTAYESMLSMSGDIDLIRYRDKRFYHIEYDPKNIK